MDAVSLTALPEETLLHIGDYLATRSLAMLARANTRFVPVSQDHLCRNLVIKQPTPGKYSSLLAALIRKPDLAARTVSLSLLVVQKDNSRNMERCNDEDLALIIKKFAELGLDSNIRWAQALADGDIWALAGFLCGVVPNIVSLDIAHRYLETFQRDTSGLGGYYDPLNSLFKTGIEEEFPIDALAFQHLERLTIPCASISLLYLGFPSVKHLCITNFSMYRLRDLAATDSAELPKPLALKSLRLQFPVSLVRASHEDLGPDIADVLKKLLPHKDVDTYIDITGTGQLNYELLNSFAISLLDGCPTINGLDFFEIDHQCGLNFGYARWWLAGLQNLRHLRICHVFLGDAHIYANPAGLFPSSLETLELYHIEPYDMSPDLTTWIAVIWHHARQHPSLKKVTLGMRGEVNDEAVEALKEWSEEEQVFSIKSLKALGVEMVFRPLVIHDALGSRAQWNDWQSEYSKC
ncbi:hypothetical protein BDV95DRAFT_610870 [Massariosphaeria phaeospora]|uniref:F-box domain-containing protein n=1 Tax=Massariosphaeria phaeospora TaxID=100035 RepID=A0A7C8M3N6_9PLEO|nr:hypothetical protein BDV95DRAFT_610870 [Massariosphaeria phaeospora]